MANKLKLPNFIIAGAQKCGTTSLYFSLKEHADIFMSTLKEIDFFNEDSNYKRGLEWYSSFFKNWHNEKVAGESSPDYFHCEKVPKRLATLLPDVKIIILLRNPVDRAYSSYWHSVYLGYETLLFDRAIELEPERIKISENAKENHSYLLRGNYAQHIERFLEYFDRSQLLILLSEQYFQDPASAIRLVAEFIGISCDERYINKVKTIKRNLARLPRNRSLLRLYPFLKKYSFNGYRLLRKMNTKKIKYPPVDLELRHKLLKHFSDSNAKLEKLLGRDLSIWRQ